jgi:hypothetical protein
MPASLAAYLALSGVITVAPHKVNRIMKLLIPTSMRVYAFLLQERMPLSLTASLALGCVVKVAPHAANKSLTEEFSISDFKVGEHGQIR